MTLPVSPWLTLLVRPTSEFGSGSRTSEVDRLEGPISMAPSNKPEPRYLDVQKPCFSRAESWAGKRTQIDCTHGSRWAIGVR